LNLVNNIAIGLDGNKWIFTSRQKKRSPFQYPSSATSRRNFRKVQRTSAMYQSGKIITCVSNQKMNSYLKEITDLCGINKELTFHIARHTFASTVTLSNGVPIESVSKMLGHKNLKTTQQYAKILDSKVSEDMKSLSEKFRNSTVEKTTLPGSSNLSTVN
jgi:site-specific recombinase XerD